MNAVLKANRMTVDVVRQCAQDMELNGVSYPNQKIITEATSIMRGNR